MALTAGTRIGSYEVLSAIGAGGMGEVYRARDLTLGRDVALKVLPELFAQDPERLARFRREAQVLASLNHPSIAQIYGVAEASAATGSGEGPHIQALALELVDGPTLADRLVNGPIPVPEALGLAVSIADALDAAHEKSVVHRDLKPANVKLTPEGRVKVLDFGLARALSEQAAADLASSPTITAVATRAGVMLGTAAYMSPEQAQGKAVDRRTDIWAFGCVLYEMLAGRQAFGGDSVTDVVVALMTREPDWSRLPADVPTRVRELLARCLQKNPRQRLRDAGDLRQEIEAALTDPGPGWTPAAAGPTARIRPAIRPWGIAALLALALAFSWLASVLAAGTSRRRSCASPCR